MSPFTLLRVSLAYFGWPRKGNPMPGDWIDERELDRLDTLKAASVFSEEQREAVEDVDAVLKRKGARPSTRTRYASKAKKLAKFLDKPFEDATRKDLAEFLEHITETYTTSGVRFVKSFVRRFYTLLLNPYEETLPNCVSWISVTKPKTSHKEPEPVLKPDDIKQLMDAAGNDRDRAIIATLYESGTRISEFCGLTIGDIEFDQYGAKITVDGKTGVRQVRLIRCVSDLSDWLNVHPTPSDPEAPLFTRLHPQGSTDPLLQSGVRRVLDKISEKAGIDKPTNPHAFRKARATELSQDLTPSEMSVYFGWVQGSAMPRVYIHLADDDVDNKLLQQAGLLKEDDVGPDPLASQTCPRCGTENSPADSYCSKCSLPLDEDERQRLIEEDEKLREKLPLLLKVLDDPEVSETFTNRLEEIQD